MNVVDSSAWLTYFADEPGAEHFAAAIETIEDLAVPSICLLEVFRFVRRQRGEPGALQAAAAMMRGQIVPLDAGMAIHAAKVATEEGLATADAVIYATTLAVDGVLWTQDAHFQGKPRVRYFPKLPPGARA